MAQGTLVLFDEFGLDLGLKKHNLETDTISVRLIDGTLRLDGTEATPVWADVSANEVSGTNYTAGGVVVATTYTHSAGVSTFAITPATTAWTQSAGAPTDIEQAVLVNDTSAGTNLIGVIDMTEDAGVTPISLVDGDITITWNPTIHTLTI